MGGWKTVETGGVGHLGGSLVLQVSGSGGSVVWVGVLGAVRFYNAGDGDILRGVFNADHWKSGKASGRWYLGDTGSGGGHKGGRDEVGSRLYWSKAGNCGAVGGPTLTLGGLCEVNGIRGGGSEAKVLMEAENDRGEFVEHVGGGSMGGGDRDSGRGSEHFQWAGIKHFRRRGTIRNRVTSRWKDDPGVGCSGTEWGRIHQEPRGWNADKADGAGLLGLHKNKRRSLRL